jgi:hypothetical protein
LAGAGDWGVALFWVAMVLLMQIHANWIYSRLY